MAAKKTRCDRKSAKKAQPKKMWYIVTANGSVFRCEWFRDESSNDVRVWFRVGGTMCYADLGRQQQQKMLKETAHPERL